MRSINPLGSDFELGVSGSSISSMNELAESKGYKLVAMIGCNVVFVTQELLHHIHVEEVTPVEVFTYEGNPIKDLAWPQKLRKIQVRVLESFRSHEDD